MDVIKIRALLESLKYGSFSKAAEKIQYTQSGLTQMMNALEKELGRPVLNRSRQGISLNDAGKYLEPYFRALVEADDILNEKIRELNSSSRKSLRIASLPTMATFWLPDLLIAYQAFHPEIDVQIQIHNMDVSDFVFNDKADIGFTDADHKGNNYWKSIKTDSLYAVIPIFNPLASLTEIPIEKLTDYPLIIPSTNEHNPAVIALKKFRPKRHMQMSANNIEAIFRIVELSGSVSIASQMNQYNCPDTIRMLPLIPSFERELGIVYSSTRRLPDYIQDFLTLIDEKKESLL